MKKDKTYHDFIVYDLMSRLFEVSSKPMMSGWCIYSSKIPFASIIGNQLYIKAQGKLAQKLKLLNWTRFSYAKTNGQTVKMNYWHVPDELLDDQDLLNEIFIEAISG